MILVTRFVAEAIVEEVGIDNVIEDTDSDIQVLAVPSALNTDDIRKYVTAQHGGNEDDADVDMKYSFNNVDMTSQLRETFYWEE
ncbi:hypothetical protein [Alteromonas gracilis]|uniref:hypothetical protein n=1 Tax=Alteromonas gracilis TaxID=1479524 RepID=UPI00373510EF